MISGISSHRPILQVAIKRLVAINLKLLNILLDDRYF